MNKLFEYIWVLSLAVFLYWFASFFISQAKKDLATAPQQQQDMAMTASQPMASVTPSLGEKLFKSNCASCHKLGTKLIGPALSGVEERWAAAGDYQGISAQDWLRRYIRNWQDPVKAGHPYSTKIINYDPSAMTTFPQLTEADVDSILQYIN